MRWACEDAIKSQLVDPRSYKAVKVRYGKHIMNEHPDAVVDARISFDAKNSFGGNSPSFGRCAFDSNGKMVRFPNGGLAGMGLSRGRNISKKTTEDLYYLQSLQVQHDKFLCHHPYLSVSSKAYSSR